MVQRDDPQSSRQSPARMQSPSPSLPIVQSDPPQGPEQPPAEEHSSSPSKGLNQSTWRRNPHIKILPPAHLRHVAQWLCRLPSEVLIYYSILEAYSLRSILLLTGSLPNSEILDYCITSQKEYKRVFPSMEQLANVRNTYLFLYELRVIKGLPATTAYSSPLACTAGQLANWKPSNLRALQNHLVQAIKRILTDQEDVFDNSPRHIVNLRRLDLRDYLKAQYLQDLDAQRTDSMNFRISRLKNEFAYTRNMYTPSYFQHMQKSTIILRHEQLACMAELLECYPEILKRTLDPHPEPRPNWKHSVRYLRGLASQLRKDRRKRWSSTPAPKYYVAPALFCSDIFPLVPSDNNLALFVNGITKLLPFLPIWLAKIVSPSVYGDLDYRLSQLNSSVRLFDTSFSKLCLLVDESLYPPSVLKDIKTAVEGMAIVHILPQEATDYRPRVLRTRWTPWSADPYRQSFRDEESPPEHKAVFMVPPLPHLDVVPPAKLDKTCIRFYIPTERELHSILEFEWLHAFCRTVRFLERLEHGGNPAYDRAVEQQRQIDVRIEDDREWRRYVGSDEDSPRKKRNGNRGVS